MYHRYKCKRHQIKESSKFKVIHMLQSVTASYVIQKKANSQLKFGSNVTSLKQKSTAPRFVKVFDEEDAFEVSYVHKLKYKYNPMN